MIRQYLKDSLHWLHLFCFKLRTFEREADKLSHGQAVAVFLKMYPWFFLLSLFLLAVIGLACEWARVPFAWQSALTDALKGGLVGGLVIESVGRLVIESVGRFRGEMVLGLVDRLGSGLGVGLGLWLGGGLVGLLVGLLVVWLDSGLGLPLGGGLVGLPVGLGVGLGLWLGVGLGRRLGSGLGVGLGLWLGVGLLLFLLEGQDEAVRFAVAYFPVMLMSFLLSFGRPYYWPFYIAQFWRARRSGNWLARFRHSPVHWDETIGLPLPWLSNWLFEIAKADRQTGLTEVLWVAAERPFQRKAAQKALLKLAVYDLTQFRSVTDLRQAATAIDFLPEEETFIVTEDGQAIVTEDGQSLVTEDSGFGPAGLSQARPHLDKIAELADDYLKRQTPPGQHKSLLELQIAIKRFAIAMALAPAPTGPELQRVAAQWLQFVNAAEAELRARLPFENPFIAGNPLKEHEENLFKGRRDLVVKLEEAIFTQRPSLLLYGRRRTGKTSTLLNLPRLMSSQLVPVFIDCQNARWNDSDAMFCYHLTRSLYDELVKRKLAEGLAQPNKSEFEPHAFTRLDEFLDELEAHSRRINKQILLTFDEYERLEEGIRDGKLTRAVLNQIRAIVQHRERLIVLFSGSHRFEELQGVNWSDYLINVQTLYLSFLKCDEARELLEHPTPEFALGYAPGVVDRVLDLTHGQPYLVQALGSEMVNTINSQQRKEATLADLDIAIERVLGMADAYFENNWRDCNAAEQAVLLALAQQQADGLPLAERQAALLGLSRKELIEPHGEQWQFTVELFRLWVKQEKAAAVTALLPA